MNRLRSFEVRVLLLTTVVLLFTSSCSKHDPGSGAQTTPFSAKLVKAADPGDMEKRLKAELVRWYEHMNAYNLYGCIAAGGATAGGQPGTAATGASGSGTTTAHSETNVQEAGVDEGDLVKTDGTYIYLARGSHFFILLADPADQSAVVSDIDLQEFISELYVIGSRVTVITAKSGSLLVGPAAPTDLLPSRISTMVYCYDVTTPAAPVLTASFDIPGYAQGSRHMNDTLYLVTNFTIDLLSPATVWDYFTTGSNDPDAFNAASQKALTENLKRIDAMTLDELLPTCTTTFYASGVTSTISTVPAVEISDTYIPEFGNGIDLSMVTSIGLSGPSPSIVGTTAVLSSWCRLYMSTDNLYLVSNNNWLWIDPVAALGMPQSNPEPRTAVHKFGVAGPAGPLLYRGSGVVDGWLNDRFSMSDYLGHLRIGTTRGGWWGEDISNQLAVMDEQDGGLTVVGRLAGLAPGERIYSMRFDRTRGYMVTFKQTDPLFTLDLTDPKNPRVAGEIKVNGFATYIHLLGADSTRLLTVGRSADASGRVTGNKLQLFDVTDLSAPGLLADLELGAGWSDALYDPHAFLYYEPLGILTIPYYAYGSGLDAYRSGLDVFTVGTSSLARRGTIMSPVITGGYGTYLDTVDRAVIIGNTIFAMAHRSVIAADADQLNVISSLTLPESYPFVSVGGGTAGGGGTTGGPTMPIALGINRDTMRLSK